MLTLAHTNGADAGLGAADSDLIRLRNVVVNCISALPFVVSDDGREVDARVLSCKVDIGNGLQPFTNVSLVEPEDRALMFDISRRLLLEYRNTDVNSTVSDREVEFRRIAARQLVEHVDEGGANNPSLALLTLSTVSRVEPDPTVLNTIIDGMRDVLVRFAVSIPSAIRIEALNSLRRLETSNPNPGVRAKAKAERAVIDAALAKIGITPSGTRNDSGTPTSTSPSTRSRFTIPLIVTAATAAVGAGVLWLIFRPHATHALGMGPLRRKVESARRRRSTLGRKSRSTEPSRC